jgi:Flp pilus assembly protein TadG
MGRVKRPERLGNDRGQALIEFALGGTMFLLALIGMTQYGVEIYEYNMVSNLAQEGVRWASVRGTKGASPASGAQVQTYVRSRAIGMTVNVTTTSVDPATQACTTTEVDPSSLRAGQGVCVQVTSTFTPFTSFVTSHTTTLQSTAQMIMSR